VSKQTGFIVRGHGRVMAAVASGQNMVPVDYQDYADEAAEMADLIADNRLSELSVIDKGTLKDLLEDLDTGDFDMLLTGFDMEEIEEMVTENADIPIEPEIKFSEVLREEHNYVVLYFDNEIDWLQAESLLGLQTVKQLSTRTDGEVSKSQERRGVGRVLNGRDVLERLRNEYQR
jgi:ParB-like chromosome segregation protein Spo0J